jgi:hypothetical protein
MRPALFCSRGERTNVANVQLIRRKASEGESCLAAFCGENGVLAK